MTERKFEHPTPITTGELERRMLSDSKGYQEALQLVNSDRRSLGHPAINPSSSENRLEVLKVYANKFKYEISDLKK